MRALTILFLGSLCPAFLSAQSGSFEPYGIGCLDSAIDLELGNDDVAVGLDLGFTFAHDGGSTTTIDVSANGYIYLESGAITSSRCCAADVPAFLADGPSLAVFGADLDPSAGGGVYFETITDFTGGTAVITWYGVPQVGTNHLIDAQCRLQENGTMLFIYSERTMNGAGDVLVGYSPGHGVTDPGASNLGDRVPPPGPGPGHAFYEVFHATNPFDLADSVILFVGGQTGYFVAVIVGDATVRVDGPFLTASSLPTAGQTTTITCYDLDPATTAATLMFGGTTADVALDSIGMPGCSLLVGDVFFSGSMTRAADTATFDLPIGAGPSTIGLVIHVQAAALVPSANPRGVVASERATLTVGP